MFVLYFSYIQIKMPLLVLVQHPQYIENVRGNTKIPLYKLKLNADLH